MVHLFVIAYIDDILIYSDTEDQHIGHIRQVLQRLREHQLYIKGEKCEFHCSTVKFLGYVIFPRGIAMDQDKVLAIWDWPQPKTIKDLQKFLGFVNFYRQFIQISVAAPLTDLFQRGEKKLKWTPRATYTFKDLKRHFCSAPILRQPDL